MEKYFIVTDENKLKKDYTEYIKNTIDINKIVKEFMKTQEIETKGYCPRNKYLFITPTAKDEETFKTQLCKSVLDDGLRRFKKNSEVNKAWVETLTLNNIKVVDKPFIPFYFKKVLGSVRSRLFEINGNVYCSLEHPEDFETPKGMEEMKASEFFKIIEDFQENKAN